MPSYARTAVPAANVLVRRRRYGEKVHLLLDNYYVIVDELPDFVWLGIDGEKTVGHIADDLAHQYGCAPDAALEATCEVLEMFARQSLVEFAASRPEGEPTPRDVPTDSSSHPSPKAPKPVESFMTLSSDASHSTSAAPASSSNRTNVRQKLDEKLDGLIARFYQSVPSARHQVSGEPIDLAYYKRHNIETILRLRMKRRIDALTIHYFTKHNPALAKVWADYTSDEMLHDRMFAKDLEAVGVAREEIYAKEPLLATKLLQGYFYYGLEHEEKPFASLASSYFIEYTTAKTQPAWIDNLEKLLGAEKVKGQRAHLGHDLEDHHIDFVWNVLATFVNTPEDEAKLLEHIDNIYHLFCMYFAELHALVAKGKNSEAQS